jgi:tetrahydromethanopterin S-methyltransferase subunit D
LRAQKKHFIWTAAVLALIAPAAHATSFDVSVDTSQLATDASLTGPFGIDYQLIQGDGSVVNTATISNINLLLS